MSNKNVYPIKIKITTNINKEPFELKHSTIYDPAPGNTPRKIVISDYPYFTADVEYNETILAKKTYSEILNIFFDKQEFVSTFLKGAISTLPKNESQPNSSKKDIANKNIMTMIKFLFPTSYPTKNNINTSYRKYLRKKGPKMNVDIDVKNIFSSGEITAEGKRTYSYIKTSNGICTVSEVIWLNDVLNYKLYRELIEQIVEYTEWRGKQSVAIDEDIKTATKQLLDGLNAKKTGDFVLGENARNELENQKRVYSPDDIRADMITIMKKYLVPGEGQETKLNKEIERLVDYFIEQNFNDKNKSQPITQLTRLKDKLNFKYMSPSGYSHLFSAHKRYDGADRQDKIAKLNSDKQVKTNELEKLENGYINNRKVLIFGKKDIDTYLQNLEKLVYMAQNQNTVPSIDEIKQEIKQNIEKLNDENESSYNYIQILGDEPMRKTNFFKIDRRGNVDGFINKIDERIKQVSKSKLDELEKQIAQLTAEIKSIDENIVELQKPPEKIFSFENDTSDTLLSIEDLLKENSGNINKLQEDLFKNVITRYNRFKEIKGSADLIGKYVEIDTSLDTIIGEIQKLEKLVETENANPGKIPDITSQILDITEIIKNSFDKLTSSGKINISRKIGEKLAQIIKLSNQIKFLTQLKALFFKEPMTGIFVDYEKKLDPNDSSTKLIIDELKQEKYSNLKKIIDFINEKFIKNNVVSLNNDLDKLTKDYFKNQNNEFYTQVVNPANQLLNSGITPDFESLKNIWDVSVISVKSASGGSEYNVSLYINVIEGELNDQNKSEIKCQYQDEDLVRRFEELTDTRPEYGPIANAKVFSIKKAKEDKEKREEKTRAKIEAVKGETANKPKQVEGDAFIANKRRTKSLNQLINKRNKTKKNT